METGKRIINIDETWLNETSFIRKIWAKTNDRGNMNLKTIQPRLSMIAALDTEGKVWFSLNHANTDGDVITLFLKHMISTLDQEEPGWQYNTVFLWDNAPYHSSAQTQSVINRLGLQFIYSGPYSYDAAPIETLFSQIKLGELNPENGPTGKRSLHEVGEMIQQRLVKIPQSQRIAYWHQTVLHLYRYIALARI